MKKRIAVIGLKGLPAYGGAASVGENIIHNLQTIYDFTVYSISSHTSNKTGFIQNCYQIVFKKIPIKKLNTIYYYIISSLHAVFIGKYDLVHIHHRDASFVLPLLRLRYKIILTTHGMILTEKWSRFNMLFLIQDRMFLRFASCVICVSQKDYACVSQHLKKNIVHIPNGVKLSCILSKHKELSGNLLFAAGRILPSKGCHIFLEALKSLNYKDKIKIVGDIHQLRYYEREIYKLSLGLNVDFIGLIKNKDELFNIIVNSKIFVFPSRIESMSMMLLEVASVKTPIICSDIQENKDVFNENEVLFFQTECIDDLASKIKWALDNPEQMYEKAEKAYLKLFQNHTWEKISSQYDVIYKTLIKGNSVFSKEFN